MERGGSGVQRVLAAHFRGRLPAETCTREKLDGRFVIYFKCYVLKCSGVLDQFFQSVLPYI